MESRNYLAGSQGHKDSLLLCVSFYCLLVTTFSEKIRSSHIPGAWFSISELCLGAGMLLRRDPGLPRGLLEMATVSDSKNSAGGTWVSSLSTGGT